MREGPAASLSWRNNATSTKQRVMTTTGPAWRCSTWRASSRLPPYLYCHTEPEEESKQPTRRTFPFELVAVVRGRVYVVQVQLGALVQLVREQGAFAAVQCQTDVWGGQLLLRLLAGVHGVVWRKRGDIRR